MPVNQLMETIFNIAYLLVIYILVILMITRLVRKPGVLIKAASVLTAAFLLLAIGDTGHVGFRVIASLNGGLEANSFLVGIGSLATALTVTVFYMLMMEFFSSYSEKKHSGIYWFVMCAGVIRIIFMLFPGNNWGGETDLVFSWVRNGILTVMGIIIAVLMLKHGIKSGERILKVFGVLILISYGFYLPVILFVHINPSIGVLMIPKTCAYIAMAAVAYKNMLKGAAE